MARRSRGRSGAAIWLLCLLIACGLLLPRAAEQLLHAPRAAVVDVPLTPAPPVRAWTPEPARLSARALFRLEAGDQAGYAQARDACLASEAGERSLRYAILARSARYQAQADTAPLNLDASFTPWDAAVAFTERALQFGTPCDAELRAGYQALAALRAEARDLQAAQTHLRQGEAERAYDGFSAEFDRYGREAKDGAQRARTAWAGQVADRAVAQRAGGQFGEAARTARAALAIEKNRSTEAAYEAAMTPDWSWLTATSTSAYQYEIVWEPAEFDPAYPLAYQRVERMPQADRARMERLIRQWAMLYPPDHFNAHVSKIYVYRTISVAVLDENDKPVLNKGGQLSFENIVGASIHGVILMTDRFNGDAEILRALVHEMAHVESDSALAGDEEARTQLYAALRELNGDFVYWYERPGIRSTSDIAGWKSSDGSADWKGGWARRYGQLAVYEDMTTLTEKLLLGPLPKEGQYPALAAKLAALEAYRHQLHPAFTNDFYEDVLPKALAKTYSP